jgi:hypothetical protein
MIIRKKLTLEEAKSEKKKLIAFLKKQPKELRTILAHAKLNNAFLVLGFKSFEAYLKDCIATARIDMKPDYARKCANAGIVEMHILGEDKIGTMPEGALRIFSENIDKTNWIPVYKLAKKWTKCRYPTNQKIIKAAKSLKVYKKDETKSQVNLKEKNTNIRTSNKPSLLNGAKGNGNKTFNTGVNNIPDVESDNKVSSSNSSNAKILSIKSLTSDKVCKHIISKYKANDIKKILGFLRVSQDEIVQNSCDHILTHCKEVAVKNTIIKLSRHIKDRKSTTTKKGIKKAG